jgi:GTP-binding protein HflX
VGLRGPGETKLETDRRRIRSRISRLRREISAMEVVRSTKRGRRRANEVPSVAIAGYTNAGKSSLLNALTGAGVLVEDSLFATLDATTRRSLTPEGHTYTLTDTVGFVRHLPHQLIEAFRSTLDEVADADLIVHVVDGSDPMPEWQVEAVREVLGEISDRRDEPMPRELLVVNKIDAANDVSLARLRHLLPGAVFVSAHSGAGITGLRDRMASLLPRPSLEVDVLVPYTRGELIARVHREGEVLTERHTEVGTALRARVKADLAGVLADFSVNGTPA